MAKMPKGTRWAAQKVLHDLEVDIFKRYITDKSIENPHFLRLTVGDDKFVVRNEQYGYHCWVTAKKKLEFKTNYFYAFVDCNGMYGMPPSLMAKTLEKRMKKACDAIMKESKEKDAEYERGKRATDA